MRECEQGRAAKTIAAHRKDNVARMDGLAAGDTRDRQRDAAVRAWRDGGDMVFVAHVDTEHIAIPAQIVHPLQPRDLVERVPRLCAELRFEPRAERERRQAERGIRELLR